MIELNVGSHHASHAPQRCLREALNESDLAAAGLHDRASKRVLQLAEPPEVGVGPWGGPKMS